MKEIKKQVLLVLSIMACFFCLTGCTKAQEAPSLGESESQSLQMAAQALLTEVILPIADTNGEAAVKQYRDNNNEGLAAGMESYLGLREELGAFVSVNGGSAEENEEGYTIDLEVTFQKRDCEFSINLDKKLEKVLSMSFNPVYTTGENMTKAALNTLMGMGTVFAVLIFISWLISCFRYIRYFEDKMNKKNPAPVPAVNRAVPAPAPAAEEDLTDDLELVAVITAAIAASEDTPADGLVVRSIRRVPGSKWKKA